MGIITYFQARLRSFGFAFKGIFILIQGTPNARIHLLATIIVITVAILLEVEAHEWALLALAMGTVWTAEAINSALESLTDLASPQRHPLAGKAKDLAAGAVLLAAIFAVGVAAAIFLPKIL